MESVLLDMKTQLSEVLKQGPRADRCLRPQPRPPSLSLAKPKGIVRRSCSYIVRPTERSTPAPSANYNTPGPYGYPILYS